MLVGVHMDKKIVLAVVLVGLISLIVVHDAASQSTGAIFINGDGSVSGTNKIQRNGNRYSLTDNIYDSPLVVQCNNIVIDGEGFVLQGAGGWGTPGVAGTEATPAINLTCSNVTVQNFNILDWEVGVLGAYNSNTISNNNITRTERAIAIYADQYNVTGNYLANSIYGVRIQGNNNRISQNQIVNNYGGVLISSSSGIIIVENNIANNNTAVNTDNSNFQIYHNNFINGANTTIVTTTLDAFPGFPNGGTLPSWDNGKEGNYWNDYTTKYPNAIEIDHTGIGDTPYLIRVDPTVTDRYPLVAPFHISETSNQPSTTMQSPNPSPSSMPSIFQQPTQSSKAEKPFSLSPKLVIGIGATLAVVTVLITISTLNRRKQIRQKGIPAH
jgi:hypothetical protein